MHVPPRYLGIVGNLFPVKKLFLTATFDGILPKETRQKAIHARGHFDNLYLVVDQQNRWKSELLPVPASALLDPLLIGEKRERSGSSYFLIDQFDLTKAEDYLTAEFLINPEDAAQASGANGQRAGKRAEHDIGAGATYRGG